MPHHTVRKNIKGLLDYAVRENIFQLLPGKTVKDCADVLCISLDKQTDENFFDKNFASKLPLIKKGLLSEIDMKTICRAAASILKENGLISQDKGINY